MSRLRADFLLLITALIWGTTFIAQKTAMATMGPFLFVGLRFFISAVLLLPLACWEAKKRQISFAQFHKKHLGLLCLVFFMGVAAQQVGMLTTTVTNAGFLTSLYVLMTPFVAWVIFKLRPQLISWIAAPLCVLGVWLLGDGSLEKLTIGDGLVALSAFFFAVHTVLISLVVLKTRGPFMLVFAQYCVCSVLGLVVGIAVEEIDVNLIFHVLPEILYAGVMSGAIAYTLQAVTQVYTPPSDAAVILSGEALFAAMAGAWILHDVLSLSGWIGCGLIFFAIVLVQIAPHLRRKKPIKNVS